MEKFKTAEEAIKWGKEHIDKYCSEPVLIDGKLVLLCCDSRCYEDAIWSAAYDLLEDQKVQIGTENLPDDYGCTTDMASDLRDVILEWIEENTGVRYLDVFDEF